jgi:hypothetical protein
MHKKTDKLAFILALALALPACESTPSQHAPSGPPKSGLQFLDIEGFDRDLAASLLVPLPTVEVTFYDRITPSALPERLQRWLAAVEAGGGTVKVVPPKANFTTRSPLLVISAISSLWSGSKMVREISTQTQFNAAQVFSAEILLKQDDAGDSVVDRIVFVQRK